MGSEDKIEMQSYWYLFGDERRRRAQWRPGACHSGGSATEGHFMAIAWMFWSLSFVGICPGPRLFQLKGDMTWPKTYTDSSEWHARVGLFVFTPHKMQVVWSILRSVWWLDSKESLKERLIYNRLAQVSFTKIHLSICCASWFWRLLFACPTWGSPRALPSGRYRCCSGSLTCTVDAPSVDCLLLMSSPW